MGKRELVVLKGVSLNIEQGELVAIMLPSGSGKTTLLNILGCLDTPTSGNYQLEGREVSRLKSGELAKIRGQKIGFIFQTFNLLSRLTALANVELGMRYAGGVDRQRAIEALAKVGLAERIRHRPIELSGGEQQRVAIARALVNKPLIILADEPTGNLDTASSRIIMSLLLEQSKKGITVVVVTHEEDIASFTQRTIYLRDGKIVEEKKR